MQLIEHRIKLELDLEEFSKFFRYYSEGHLHGSHLELETDELSYFEGVSEKDLCACFGDMARFFFGPPYEPEMFRWCFDLVLEKQ